MMTAARAFSSGEQQVDNGALQAVRELLRQWAQRTRDWRPDLGYSLMSYERRIRGTIDPYTTAEDYDERIEASAMVHLDVAIENLHPAHRTAIRAIYLRETAPSLVNGYSRSDLACLCDAAEIALIPALRRRDVLL
jgi:hypothetical protein